MDKSIEVVLEKLEENGFKAYIVGGYVRDYLLGIETKDIDICTNALPKDLVNIFESNNLSGTLYGSFKISSSNYNFDITTFRKEIEYDKRRPTKLEYVDDLLTDLKRRDFTINTLCMDKTGKIIDLLDAKTDLQNRIIRCVDNIDNKLKEDPLRILRAVRFATTLNFTLSDDLIIAIMQNKALISSLSETRKKYELDRILSSENVKEGLDLLKKLGLLEYLGINYNDKLVYVEDICGMYSQLEITLDYPFTRSEKENITKIKEILEYGKVDYKILFNYGLYLSIVAGKIMDIDITLINQMFNTMPIKSHKDIAISSLELCEVLNIKPSKMLKDIFKDITNEILNNKIENNYESIKEFVIQTKGKWFNEGNDWQGTKN